MTGLVTTFGMLSSTFLATKIMTFQVIACALCTNSSYSIFCLVPSLASLLVRLVIAKAR